MEPFAECERGSAEVHLGPDSFTGMDGGACTLLYANQADGLNCELGRFGSFRTPVSRGRGSVWSAWSLLPLSHGPVRPKKRWPARRTPNAVAPFRCPLRFRRQRQRDLVERPADQSAVAVVRPRSSGHRFAPFNISISGRIMRPGGAPSLRLCWPLKTSRPTPDYDFIWCCTTVRSALAAALP